MRLTDRACIASDSLDGIFSSKSFQGTHSGGRALTFALLDRGAVTFARHLCENFIRQYTDDPVCPVIRVNRFLTHIVDYFPERICLNEYGTQVQVQPRL